MGPDINEAREGHGCSSFDFKGKLILIIAGGGNCHSFLVSVELLDMTSDKGWSLGKLDVIFFRRNFWSFENFSLAIAYATLRITNGHWSSRQRSTCYGRTGQ